MRVLLLLVLSLAVPFYTFTVASPTGLPPEDDGILTSSMALVNVDGTRAPDHNVVTGSLHPEPPTAEHDPATEVPPSPVPTQAVVPDTDSATHRLFPTNTDVATAEPTTEGVQTSAPPMEAETTPGLATGAETIGAVTTTTASVTEAATLRAETERAEPEEAETEGAETSEQEAGAADVVIEDPDSEESGLSSGQVVGIVIGVLLAVFIVIAVVVSVFRRMGKYTH